VLFTLWPDSNFFWFMTLKLCVAQLNFCVGDLDGNVQKIVTAAHEAHAAGARLLLTPELSICGYAAEDLFLRPAFIQACDDAVKSVARQLAGLKDMAVVVGHPTGGDSRTRSVAVQSRFNSASVLREGQVVATYAKRELPNYQVFDERRYFTPGEGVCVFEAGSTDEGGALVRVGLLICEDAWFEAPARLAREAGTQVLAVINASPFHVGKGYEREDMMRVRAQATGLPLVYAHLVGGQDEVVFEGHSFVLDAGGVVAGRAPSFKENMFYVRMDVEQAAIKIEALVEPVRSPEADLWDALVLGVRDYIGKNGFPGGLLGLSGGIDSAVVLAVAVDALGADKVRTVMMPSPYTADISWIDAREMAQRLGVRYDEISILPEFEAFKASLAGDFAGRAEDTTEENIQARIRGTLLMALSNKFGSIVLTTGNKSEMATGYCTLYGDMAGGFAVLKDVSKTWVYRLSNYRNSLGRVIPERIITRPPSAELKPDQTDQDNLPPYDVLDAIMACYVEKNMNIAEIMALGYAEADVHRVVKLIRIAEYKRRQAPVGVRITDRGFGKDWRYPITVRYQDEF
jgi:NAD+ synthase (glutamine-hydrolysing)